MNAVNLLSHFLAYTSNTGNVYTIQSLRSSGNIDLAIFLRLDRVRNNFLTSENDIVPLCS